MIPNLLPKKLLHKLEESPSGCWLWTGYRSDKGYGVVHWEGRKWRVHRLVTELLLGVAIPPDQDLHHASACPNKHCANPAHLELLPHAVHGSIHGTEGGHIAAGRSRPSRRKTVCNYGHPMTEDNTYTRPTGERECRTCRSEKRHPVS